VRRWFVILASVAILLGLARAAGFREVLDVWRSVEPRGIVLSALCYYAAVTVRILLWRRLLGPEAPSFAALAPPLAAGFVLGHVTPAKSGEPAASLLVSRAFGLPLSRTLAVLTAERAVQLVALLATFAPAATLAAGGVLEIRGAVLAALLVLAALVAAAALLPEALPRLAEQAAKLPRFGPAARDYLRALADLSAGRKLLPSLGALAVLFWTLSTFRCGRSSTRAAQTSTCSRPRPWPARRSSGERSPCCRWVRRTGSARSCSPGSGFRWREGSRWRSSTRCCRSPAG
jgi:uncharacterized membrane protein YbhN (UPF0104 family)